MSEASGSDDELMPVRAAQGETIPMSSAEAIAAGKRAGNIHVHQESATFELTQVRKSLQ
jgi:hypothetical protein